MNRCGVLEVSGVEDALGVLYGRDAVTSCEDCGTSLCKVHSGACSMCGNVFCQACLSFHTKEHAKGAAGENVIRRKAS